MKTNRNLLFLYTLFIWIGVISWCEAAAPSYERMKTLIWQHTIYFIYEDNGMMEQYQKNYGTHTFGRIADFENLKDDAGEKRFYTSVQDSITTKDTEGEKAKIEREIEAIILGLKNNRRGNLAKLVKVDSLQRTLYQLIQDEYQPTQYQQPASNAEEIIEPLPDTDTSSLNDWIIPGLLMLIVLLMGLAIWRMGKLGDRLIKKVKYILQEREYQYSAYDSFYPSLSQPDVQQLDKKLMAIQEELENIKEQISQLHGLNRQTSSSTEEMSPAENFFMTSLDDAAQDKRPVTESRPALFYAKKPNNYLFKQETLFTTARHDSIYRIQEDKDGMATFTINEDKKVQDYALQNGGEMFLNEACEIQYENNRPVRIITDAPGKLVKEGKHWRIQEKARVILR